MSHTPPSDPAHVDGLASFAVDPAMTERFVKASRLCAVSVAAIGVTVLSGWLAGLDALKSIGLDAESMKVNTALGLLAAAVCLAALILIRRSK